MGKRRTRIVIETEEVIVARGITNPVSAWCSQCGAERQMLTVAQSALLCGMDPNTIQERIERGDLHVSGTPALICLASLARNR